MSETAPTRTVETELALLGQKIETVIKTHDEKLERHDVLHSSAHTKIAVLELQSNTHEVKIASLQEKAMGAFGKTAIFISTAVAALSLIWNVFK